MGRAHPWRSAPAQRDHTALTDMISVQYLMARDGELPQFWWRSTNSVCRGASPDCRAAPALVLIISQIWRAGGAVRHRCDRRCGDQRHALRNASAPAPAASQGADADARADSAGDLGDAGMHQAACATLCDNRDDRRPVGGSLPAGGGAEGREAQLIRQAIMEQLTAEQWPTQDAAGTYGSEALVPPVAGSQIPRCDAVVVFIREVNLSISMTELTIETDARDSHLQPDPHHAHQMKVT